MARGKLHGLALLAFFGLGLGPARFGEIFRMDRRSICYEHGYVRYATVSVKKGSTFAAGFRNTERRLCPIPGVTIENNKYNGNCETID